MRTLLAVPIALGLTCPAGATTMLRLDLDELARRAQGVVTGSVVATRAEHDPATGLIVTIATLAEVETLAGPAMPARLEVQTLGGRMGDIRQVVDGEAVLAPGERVAVFLRRLKSGRLAVAGMQQGKLDVVAEAQALSVRRPGGLPVYDPAAGGYVRLEPLSLDLRAFTLKVRAARGEP